MTFGPIRARSNTSGSTASSRPRPISRASTTSINTSSAQPAQPYRHVSESSYPPPPQTQPMQYTPEEMITRSEQQLTNPNQEYAIDPSLQDQTAGARAMSVDHAFAGNPNATRPSMANQQSFDGRASSFQVPLGDDQLQDDGTVDARKKKGSASSIANDQELRRLFKENHHRTLKDIAGSVLQNERGPKSEKTKQIFAMNWLNSVCKKSSSSVPRNRVFSHYAHRCGTERVPPLNPASFGKLVRIIFPGIQTRRLGMRGESKYHYVDLALIDDPNDGQGGEHIPETESFLGGGDNPGGRRSHHPDQRYHNRPRSQLPADTAVFPSPNIPINPDSRPIMRETKAAGCLYLNPALPNIHQGPSGPNMVRRQLSFPAYQEPLYTEDEPIELPSLQSYLPTGTDSDSANALVALYRTHCISVIDCFRFCKEKMFWHHFTSFHGTLTVPVQKLLAHPAIAAWVTECDWLMYQRMIRFVSPLALQVMPPKVIDTFRNISVKLSHHISNTFQNHPQHVRDAKLGPATIFAGLIDRLLRVNATAHAAANMLTNDANRDQMWHDWICYVRPISVVESSLPGAGYTRTLQILTNEVRELLGPLTATSYAGMQPIYTNAAHNNFSQHANTELDDSSTSGVLDRWTTFLHDLPTRFPGADARLLLHCVGEVGSAALRDITMAQALSFGSWWVTKVWVDEMLQWLAEKGGFLEQSPSSMDMRPQKRSAFEAGFNMDDRDETYGGSRPRTGVSDATEGPSRYGSVDPRSEFQREQSHMDPQAENDRYRQPTTAPMDGTQHPDGPQTPHLNHESPQHKNKATELEQIQSHDDSGIGMDFELPQNTPLRLADYGGFVASGTNVGSDPADVVVC